MHVVVEVKKIIGTAVLAGILFINPLGVLAASAQDTQALTQRIAFLTAQVVKLQQQLQILKGGDGSQIATNEFYKTKFYTGTYEALYFTDGKNLVRQDGGSVRVGDTLLWNTFIEIAGDSFADAHISEFRIYNDTNSSVSAFVEEKPDKTWILGFNREGERISDIYQDDGVIDLLLHEYAHIVFFSRDGIADDFKDEFWGTSKRASYKESQFVSEYAATSPDEDLAESFVAFVSYNKPDQKGIQYDKIRFFYDYPSMVTLRTQLRESNHI